jgi:hypothetical protein
MPTRSGRVAAVLSCCTGALLAQCNVALAPSDGTNGIDDFVFASVPWDPDGPGPGAALIALGGRSRLAGATVAAAVVAYDPSLPSFTALGAGISGGAAAVDDLLPLPNGELVASGTFTAPAGRSRWCPVRPRCGSPSGTTSRPANGRPLANCDLDPPALDPTPAAGAGQRR